MQNKENRNVVVEGTSVSWEDSGTLKKWGYQVERMSVNLKGTQ
jgi:hypothetical protein